MSCVRSARSPQGGVGINDRARMWRVWPVKSGLSYPYHPWSNVETVCPQSIAIGIGFAHYRRES